MRYLVNINENYSSVKITFQIIIERSNLIRLSAVSHKCSFYVILQRNEISLKVSRIILMNNIIMNN